MEMTHETTLDRDLNRDSVSAADGGDNTMAARGIQVPLELLIYAALIMLALVLRLSGLGITPLADPQAHDALAAYRAVVPHADPRPEGAQLIAANPLMFAANTLAMTIAGAGTATVLFPTAILGVIVIGLPMLFRRWLGSSQALIISALLTISPVLLFSSRYMSGTVWAAALVILGLYFAGRFAESRTTGYGMISTACFVLLALMAEPAGFIMLIGALVGLAIATSGGGSAISTSSENGEPEEYRLKIQRVLREWPLWRGLLLGGIVIGLTATVFMLYPRGVSSIGELINQGIRGVFQRPEGIPFAYPLLNSFLYEPVLWIFGLTGIVLVQRSEERTPANFIGRATIGWLGVSIVAALFYQGGQASHALWLTVPLAILSAVSIERILQPVRDRFWTVPVWGPFVHGAAVVAIFAIAGINIVMIAHNIGGTAPTVMPNIDQPIHIVYILLATMLAIITFFLVGSIWGAKATWHGMGIGVLIFLGIFSLGSGWQAAITDANNPRELWRLTTASDNLDLMVKTLNMASVRTTTSPYDMQVMVVAGENGPTDDGALAWALRRFIKTEYVKKLAPTTNAPVLIMPEEAGKPQVSAQYVGQDFPIYYKWSSSSLSWDLPGWIYDRTSRIDPDPVNRVVVWVRSDVYGLAQDSGDLTSAPLVPAQP